MQSVADGNLTVEAALASLQKRLLAPERALELDFARPDLQRAWRQSFPEVVFAPGKSSEQIFQIALELRQAHDVVLASRAEAEQTLARARRYSGAEAERTGNTLVGLVVRDESAGLGGRTLITFAKRDQSQSLPWTRLGVGSPVMISEENVREPDGRRGVVSFRDAVQIQVATDELPEPQGDRPTYRIDLSLDEIARQRQRGALDQARRAGGDRLAKLRDVLLGQREPQFRPPAE
ncbi:MAG TPA: hypothetical protein PK671_04655, partial [Candidatus Obscuribacter sp.]|nr:hypothetical protein [Candidatus Obscuribacter sp.]